VAPNSPVIPCAVQREGGALRTRDLATDETYVCGKIPDQRRIVLMLRRIRE